MNRRRRQDRQARGEEHGRAKLSEQDVVRIRRRMNKGASHLDLVDDYPDIDPVTLWRAGTGVTWRHVTEPPAPRRMPYYSRRN